MKFKLINIEIENLFGYKNASFEDLKNYNVLIGKNNAGKSNLFRILISLDEFFEGKDLEPNILFDEDINNDASLTLTFSLSEDYREELFKILLNDEYFTHIREKNQGGIQLDNGEIAKELIKKGFYGKIQFKFSYHLSWKTFIVKEISMINLMTNESSIVFKSNVDSNGEVRYSLLSKNYLIKSQTIEEYFKKSLKISNSPSYTHDLKRIEDFLSVFSKDLGKLTSIYYNPLLSKILKDFLESIIKDNYIQYIPDIRRFEKYNDMDDLENVSLSPNGENLAKFIASKKLNDLSWHEKFNKELAKFFEQSKEFSIKSEKSQAYFYFREDGLNSEFRLENMGRGMLNIALFIAFFLSIGKGKIILIEEPELHIFPGLQKKLRHKFLQFSENNQIFISTHSPIFLLEDNEVYPVYNIRKPGIESEVERISNDDLCKVFHDLDLSMYDFMLYDGILFVEGITDLKIFEIICAKLFKENLKIIPIEGKRKLEHYASARIIHFLDRKKLKFLFILDRDRGNEEFYERIKDPEIKKIIKERTIVLPFYEIENLFIQPVLLLHYLYHKLRRKQLNKEAFTFLKDTIKGIFQKLGEKNTEYLLKKINDEIFPRLRQEEIDLILKNSQKYDNFEELFNFWYQEYEKQINNMLDYYDNIKLNKNKFISRLKEIQKDYEKKFSKELYHEIISGKKVFKKLKDILINHFKLSEFSIRDITEYIIIDIIKIIIHPGLIARNSYKIAYKIIFRRYQYLIKKFYIEDRELKKFEAFLKLFINEFLIRVLSKMDLNIKRD
ncbi:MAG: AAA family ATPase [Promethearchaeota archaeon]